ncbi:hypothetical protein PY093_11115 [Cytobacillus sp. S13-E01]|uniref:hypothetical protein n=1 Tax=Cytobacillus sp. S13-E01 TaxID=3031326 RepID=UPI0023D83D70|nr:hypothetical protein [Cytobacillus sp. S13-E01]MDF0727248.1 hypothetical protein [Cytobacillus sp. S13-E01]
MKSKQKPKLNYIGNKHEKPIGTFTQLPDEILFGLGKYEALKPNDVRIYAILLKEVSWRNKLKQVDEAGDAFCFMTQDQLGEKANIASRNTIKASIKRLEELSLVYACNNGVKKSNTYFVAYPEKQNDEKALTDDREIGKKLTDEQRKNRKTRRVSNRDRKEVNSFVNGTDDDMPDFN